MIWFQYDDGVKEDADKDAIVEINYEPIIMDKMYRCDTLMVHASEMCIQNDFQKALVMPVNLFLWC